MPRPQQTNGKFTVPAAPDVAQCFGVTPDTVKAWRARGMPGTRQAYVLEDIAKWLRSPEGPWSSRALQSSKSDDPLLAEGDSPGLERYRLAKAEHAELDLAERRGDLIERDKCREVLARWAVVIRRMGERLAKRYGAAASTEVIDTLKECESVVMEAMADADDTATD